MLTKHTKTPHLFDDATQVTAGDSRWQGKTSEDYWAFVGPPCPPSIHIVISGGRHAALCAPHDLS